MSVALALLTAHSLADFPLQTDAMAAEKFDHASVRASHCIVHVFVTMLCLAAAVEFGTAILAAAIIGILHFAIDTRRWAEPKEGFEAYSIAVDQSLHIASLFVVSVVIL